MAAFGSEALGRPAFEDGPLVGAGAVEKRSAIIGLGIPAGEEPWTKPPTGQNVPGAWRIADRGSSDGRCEERPFLCELREVSPSASMPWFSVRAIRAILVRRSGHVGRIGAGSLGACTPPTPSTRNRAWAACWRFGTATYAVMRGRGEGSRDAVGEGSRVAVGGGLNCKTIDAL